MKDKVKDIVIGVPFIPGDKVWVLIDSKIRQALVEAISLTVTPKERADDDDDETYNYRDEVSLKSVEVWVYAKDEADYLATIELMSDIAHTKAELIKQISS